VTGDADRIVDLYERNALAWDRQRGRGLFEKAWLDRFLALLPPAASILDLGCGSGEPIARYLIEAGHALTGVDTSPSLIGLCRGRFPKHEWLVGDMRALALGRCFDGILAWDSFFHLAREEQRAIFPRFAAHAKPGAALMFTSGPDDAEAIGTWQNEPLYHASLATAEYERLLTNEGFSVTAHVAEDADCGGHTIWLARMAS
jgi:SAM-dependent methyltransferase